MEKLPSAHEINPAFEPIDPDLQQVELQWLDLKWIFFKEYQDPVQLHNMLIDERLHAQQQKLQENVSVYLWALRNLSKLKLFWNFIKMDTLREEYKCLESQLTESKRVEFADKELTQARIIIFQPKV